MYIAAEQDYQFVICPLSLELLFSLRQFIQKGEFIFIKSADGKKELCDSSNKQ